MPQNTVHINLLGGFECSSGGEAISLPLGAQRLLSLLALREDGLHRGGAAECLWPESSPGRATGCLRSALWRARRIADVTSIESVGPRLRVSAAVRVDVRVVHDHVRAALEVPTPPSTERDSDLLVAALTRELLPDWVDDWLVLERERWGQVRLHALEGVAQRLLSEERYLAALNATFAAIAIEPIRETPHRIMIEVHLAEGNAASALRHYQRYRALLQRELGVAPSARMAELARTIV